MDFYQRVGIVCNRIPQGNVATYGQIALLCGKPKNSRQVGYALKMNLAEPFILNSRTCTSGRIQWKRRKNWNDYLVKIKEITKNKSYVSLLCPLKRK